MRKKLAEDIATALQTASATVESLRDIAQVGVLRYSCDARGAMQSGAVLLCVTPAPKDDHGDGFLYLLGLPRDVPLTPYLSNTFPQ